MPHSQLPPVSPVSPPVPRAATSAAAGPGLGFGLLLTALTAFGPLSTDLYLPALPTLVRVFDSDVATVQLTLSVFMAGFANAMLIYGPLSDRFGRRPVLLGGLTLYIAASLACLWVDSVGQLIVARFFQALGACAGPVVARAVVRDLFERAEAARVFSYMTMAMALAPAVGPVIGGLLTSAFGWQACFAVLVGFGLVTMAGVSLRLTETNRRCDRDALRPGRLAANSRRLAGHRGYLGYVLCSACIFCGIFAFISGSSFVLIGRLGLTPTAYGLCFATFVLGYMTGTFLSGQTTLRLGIDSLIRRGTLIAGIGGVASLGLALAVPPTVWTVLLPMVLFMIGAGLVLPNTMAGAIAPFPEIAGLASSWLGFVQMGSAALVGALVGHLYDQAAGGPLPMAAAIAVTSVLAAASFRIVVGASGDGQRREVPGRR